MVLTIILIWRIVISGYVSRFIILDYCVRADCILYPHSSVQDIKQRVGYYRVEMVNGSGSFPDKYDTYEAAYDAMCKNYVKVKLMQMSLVYRNFLRTEIFI